MGSIEAASAPDRIGGESVALQFAEQIPKARLDLWDDSSHAPWIDDPTRAARCAREALALG